MNPSWWDKRDSANTLHLDTVTEQSHTEQVNDDDEVERMLAAIKVSGRLPVESRVSFISREVAECAVISDLFTDKGRNSQASTVCTLNAPSWMLNCNGGKADVDEILVEATQVNRLSDSAPRSIVDIPPTQVQFVPPRPPALLANVKLRDSYSSISRTQVILTSQDHESDESDDDQPVFVTPVSSLHNVFAATQNLFSPPDIDVGITQSTIFNNRTSIENGDVIYIPPSDYEDDDDDEEEEDKEVGHDKENQQISIVEEHKQTAENEVAQAGEKSIVVSPPRHVQFDSQVKGGLSSQMPAEISAPPVVAVAQPSTQVLENRLNSTGKLRRAQRISLISVPPTPTVIFDAVAEVRRLTGNILPKTPNLPLKNLCLNNSTLPAKRTATEKETPVKPTPATAGKRPPLLPKPTPAEVRSSQLRFMAEVQVALKQTPHSSFTRIAPAPPSLSMDSNFIPDSLVWARLRSGWWAVGKLLKKTSPTRDLWQLRFLHKRSPIQLSRSDLLALHAVQLQDTIGIVRKRNPLKVETGRLVAWLTGSVARVEIDSIVEEHGLDRVVISKDLFTQRGEEYSKGMHRTDNRIIEDCAVTLQKSEPKCIIKRSRQPSRAPSRSSTPINKLFTGFSIAITTGAAESERTRVISLCRENGAKMVDDLMGKGSLLLAPEGCRTVRYFHALILGLPILRMEWVDQSIAAGVALSFEQFQLNDGHDRRSLLAGKWISLQGSPKFCQSWLSPLLAAGAHAADADHPANLLILESENALLRRSRRNEKRQQVTIDTLIEHLLSNRSL